MSHGSPPFQRPLAMHDRRCILRGWGLAVRLGVAGAALALTSLAAAQKLDDAEREAVVKAQADEHFQRPQVVLNTGGHHAPPRSILFSPKGDRLLSAGLDKVIRIATIEPRADGDGFRLRPGQTFRPPILRGYRGWIYAMALSPVEIDDDPGQRLLAIGGIGATQRDGTITLFRFPGDAGRETGEILGVLPEFRDNQPIAEGHTSTVTSLAFSPDGRLLASASNDGRVILWDVATRTIARIVEGRRDPNGDPHPINAVAFAPDGRYLASGGADGILMLYDPRTGQPLGRPGLPPTIPGADPRGLAILGLAVDPKAGRWIVAGCENGFHHLYPAEDLTRRQTFEKPPATGAVEAIAISPDGATLASSVLTHKLGANLGERPRLDCVIELRSLPEGRIARRIASTSNIAHALTFSPDGRFLAFGGGDSQGVRLHELARPDRPALVLEGDGWSVWDVGWSADSQVVALSRRRPDLPDGAGKAYEAFRLAERKYEVVLAADLSRALTSWDGWQVRPIAPLALVIINPQGQQRRIDLHITRDRRWWDYSIIPPGPGHARPVLAVACEAGVVLFDLETGRRLRHFDGHEGPVYTLAPSPDGRWLATGSADQTVRLWTLAGCDRPAEMGMSLRRDPDGTWCVDAVDRLGFADRDRMQLKAGDIVREAYILGKEYQGNFDQWLRDANATPPKTTIQMIVERGAEKLGVMTSKRDNPVLSLFVGLDREWVCWMQEGYYETSPIGDRRYLKWQKNGPGVDQPTDSFPADRFEKELRRPDVLLTLIQTASLDQALAAVPAEVREPEVLVASGAPPVVVIDGPPALAPDRPLVADGPNVPVTLTVLATDGRSPIREVRTQVDGLTVGAVQRFDPPVPAFNAPLLISVAPGLHRVSIIATNDQGRSRVVGFDVEQPAPVKQPPRFAIVAIGVPGPFPDGSVAPIPFASEDAQDISGTYADLAGQVFQKVVTYPPVTETRATSTAIRETFERVKADAYGPGDTLLVLLETHYLRIEKTGYFVGTDFDGSTAPENAISADELADLLAEAADTGCRVLVLVDAVHPGVPEGWSSDLDEWVRTLYRHDVIPLIASNDGPSERYPVEAHGAFVQGLLTAPTALGQSRPWTDPARQFTLDDFGEAVVRQVKELTGLRQQAALYLPETISPRSLLFEPGTADEPTEGTSQADGRTD